MVHAFLKDISLKVIAAAQLEFEITNSDFAVQHLSHYTVRIPIPLWPIKEDQMSI